MVLMSVIITEEYFTIYRTQTSGGLYPALGEIRVWMMTISILLQASL